MLGLDCLAASIAGRVEWDAEADAKRLSLDPAACKQVYQAFGDTSTYALPGLSINKTATDWQKFVNGK